MSSGRGVIVLSGVLWCVGALLYERETLFFLSIATHVILVVLSLIESKLDAILKAIELQAR